MPLWQLTQPVADSRVIERGPEPRRRQVAIAAFEIGGDVARRLAGGLHAVVTDDAEPGDRQRNLRVINRLGRGPADHGVAGRAILAGGGMARPFSLGNRAVVAADAAAEHLGVIEMHVRPEGVGVVTGRAQIRGRDVVGRFRRRVEGRAGDVAGAAVRAACP